MKPKPNILFSFLILTSSLFFYSCNKDKNDVIPDVYVDFFINLSDPLFFDLNAVGSFAYVSYQTNNLGSVAAGYDNNGIIIYRATLDQFYAYDRTCPHDFVSEGVSVKVNADGNFAVCPRCGTSYALPASGTPYSGVGRYPLKNYRTSFNGSVVHVWNH